MGENIPPPYSFQVKEPGAEPVTVHGFVGWAPEGFDSRPRTAESGTTMGEPYMAETQANTTLGMP